MKKTVLLLMVVGLLGVQAQALYVDAEGGASGNTFLASNDSADAWWTTTTAADSLWARRAFGNNPNFTLGAPGNDIFEASGTGSGVENCPMIYTVASGLIVGQLYDVDVVFWNTNLSWNIRAGFSQDNMSFFDKVAGGTQTGKIEADRFEYIARVGQIAADSSGQIKVYIDDKPATGNWDRTWYDGLIMTEVPEPATMAILGLGALLMRRKR